MRKGLFTICLLMIAFCGRSQFTEVGINAGIGKNTTPNVSLYRGDNGTWNANYGVNVHYHFSENWEAGLSIDMQKWITEDKWPLSNTANASLGEQPVTYVLADPALCFSFRFNKVFQFYDTYGEFHRASVYIGVAGGGVITQSDGEIVYSKVNPKTPAEYVYTSEYHFGSGTGYLLGAQAGATVYLNTHFGINFEVAPRFCSVKTIDSRYAHANKRYDVFSYPFTLGLHYRIGYRN